MYNDGLNDDKFSMFYGLQGNIDDKVCRQIEKTLKSSLKSYDKLHNIRTIVFYYLQFRKVGNRKGVDY